MEMRQKIIAGNWKMHGSRASIDSLLSAILQGLECLPFSHQCVIFPPAIYMAQVAACCHGSPLQWGGQNCHTEDTGAYTGEMGPSMFQDLGCRYMLVGHSERRYGFGDTEKIVEEKFHRVQYHGMIPVLCIGESAEARRAGSVQSVIRQQLMPYLDAGRDCFEHAVIAYEPLWAIGTGQSATEVQIQEVHAYIRAEIARFYPERAAAVSILYGGSVTESNAPGILSIPDVDGALVGGASLNAPGFLEILQCII